MENGKIQIHAYVIAGFKEIHGHLNGKCLKACIAYKAEVSTE